MRRAVVVLFLLAACGTQGLSALVEFAAVPTGATSVPAGEPVTFSVSIKPQTLSSCDNATVVFGLEGTGAAINVAISSVWDEIFQAGSLVYDNNGFYPADVMVMSFTDGPRSISGSALNFGTLTVSTAGLAPGDYRLEVGGISAFGLSFDSEPMSGSDSASGSFTVVPEPITVSLLAAGLIGAGLRRRR